MTPNHSTKIKVVEILYTFFYKINRRMLEKTGQHAIFLLTTMGIQSIISQEPTVQIYLFQLETVIDR
jgi:hypothetical protein